jgi:hypothetical protein
MFNEIEEYEKALHDHMEQRYDSDRGFMDEWEEYATSKQLLDEWIQETEERWV